MFSRWNIYLLLTDYVCQVKYLPLNDWLCLPGEIFTPHWRIMFARWNILIMSARWNIYPSLTDYVCQVKYTDYVCQVKYTDYVCQVKYLPLTDGLCLSGEIFTPHWLIMFARWNIYPIPTDYVRNQNQPLWLHVYARLKPKNKKATTKNGSYLFFLLQFHLKTVYVGLVFVVPSAIYAVTAPLFGYLSDSKVIIIIILWNVKWNMYGYVRNAGPLGCWTGFGEHEQHALKEVSCAVKHLMMAGAVVVGSASHAKMTIGTPCAPPLGMIEAELPMHLCWGCLN